ncbi:MAG: ABC transporter permease, partial [Gammaproteobacteria bacterium]|nr:ABC transporter permease [Gammaproteobacteria bacterium]
MVKVLEWLTLIGQNTIDFFARLGSEFLLFLQTIKAFSVIIFRPSLIIQQMYSIGVRSMLIIIVSGFFVGMVLG